MIVIMSLFLFLLRRPIQSFTPTTTTTITTTITTKSTKLMNTHYRRPFVSLFQSQQAQVLLHHNSISKSYSCLHATTKSSSNYNNNSNNNNNNNKNYRNKNKNKTKFLPLQDVDYTTDLTKTIGGYNRPIINWYPGHIAKAEHQLSETLKAVDIVLEVRDSRILKSTSHPNVPNWTGGKPRIVVCTKCDLIPKKTMSAWKKWTEVMGGTTWGAVEGTISNNQNNKNNNNNNNISNEYKEDLQVRNKAIQIWKERQKYSTSETNSEKDHTNHKNHQYPKNVDITKQVEDVIFVDAKRGQGIHAIHRAIHKAGQYVNERRLRRGLSERALRVGVIGYPNVGKSALINKILGRKRARSSNTPGVTRSLQWIRVRSNTNLSISSSSSSSSSTTSSSSSSSSPNSKRKEFELLDSPGIIPANMYNQQSDAMLLAACNSIGTNAYDNQAVVAYLLDWIQTLYRMKKQDLCTPVFRERCKERYKLDPLQEIHVDDTADNSFFMFDHDSNENYENYENNDKEKDNDTMTRFLTGEEVLFKVADNVCRGDPENAARKILQDFRTGRLGPIALQFAPDMDDEENKGALGYDVEQNMKRGVVNYEALVGGGGRGLAGGLLGEDWETKQVREQKERTERAQKAMDLAKEKGLELPPMVEGNVEKDDNDLSETNVGSKEGVSQRNNDEVGKGMFDGW